MIPLSQIATIIAIYAEDIAHSHARPNETASRLNRVLDYFDGKTLDYLNKGTCAAYVQSRGHLAAARRELEDLRAAIRHHWEIGGCTSLTPVVLPAKGEARESWLTRPEAAKLLLVAWRRRQQFKRYGTEREIAKHVARFILVGLYTGTRAGAICGAAMAPEPGRGWIDTENGIFYRKRLGKAVTKKRQPTVRIPPRLLAHIRRWKRLRVSRIALVEWNGRPIQRLNKAFRGVVKAAGLPGEISPHVLQHTAITWQAQLGVPPHEICGFFGITMEMFERVYGHHHPDYQSNAVNAFNRSKRSPNDTEQFKATDREQTQAKVIKIVR